MCLFRFLLSTSILILEFHPFLLFSKTNNTYTKTPQQEIYFTPIYFEDLLKFKFYLQLLNETLKKKTNELITTQSLGAKNSYKIHT